jgi:hypothetical protein
MTPRLQKMPKGFKKVIPGGKPKRLPSVPGKQSLRGVSTSLRSFLVNPRAKTSAQLANNAINLSNNAVNLANNAVNLANKGLQYTTAGPALTVLKAVPKGVAVLKAVGGTVVRLLQVVN